jgi:hypothetical protein
MHEKECYARFVGNGLQRADRRVVVGIDAISSHPAARLVVIDTLRVIRGQRAREGLSTLWTFGCGLFTDFT